MYIPLTTNPPLGGPSIRSFACLYSLSPTNEVKSPPYLSLVNRHSGNHLDFCCRVSLRWLVLPYMSRLHFSHILNLLCPSIATPLMDHPSSIASRSILDSVNIPNVHRQLPHYVVCFSSPFCTVFQVCACSILNILIGLVLQLVPSQSRCRPLRWGIDS